MKAQTLDEFMSRYNADGSHPVTEVHVTPGDSGSSPFILIRNGDYVAVVNPLALPDHLSIDVHSFVHGDSANAGVFGMTTGRRWTLPPTGHTSHGWPAAGLVAVLVGDQATEDTDSTPPPPAYADFPLGG